MLMVWNMRLLHTYIYIQVHIRIRTFYCNRRERIKTVERF